MLESAEFYLAQNSGAVLFHNASTFGKTGDEEGSGAISIEDFETILNGDVTLNGFRLDTMGVETYDIKYTFNGAEEHTAFDGQVFLEQGRYVFRNKQTSWERVSDTRFLSTEGKSTTQLSAISVKVCLRPTVNECIRRENIPRILRGMRRGI